MARNANLYECLLVSPSDLEEERNAVEQEAMRFNGTIGRRANLAVHVVRWETHAIPQLGGPPQALINDQLVDGCDMAIALFWSRLGTPTEEHDSGSIEEIERMNAAGRPVLIYRCSRPIEQSRLRDDQYARLQAKLDELSSRGIVETFGSVDDLRVKVSTHLAATVIDLEKRAAAREAIKSGEQLLSPEERFKVELAAWEEQKSSSIRWRSPTLETRIFANDAVPGDLIPRIRMHHPVEFPASDDEGPVPGGTVGSCETPGYRETWFAADSGAFFTARELLLAETDYGTGIAHETLTSRVAQSFALASRYAGATTAHLRLVLSNVRGVRWLPANTSIRREFVSRADVLTFQTQVSAEDWASHAATAVNELCRFFKADGRVSPADITAIGSRNGWRLT